MRYNSFFAGTEEIKDSTLERTASPASKAFNESRPRHLMSLALPFSTVLSFEGKKDVATYLSRSRFWVLPQACRQKNYD